MTNTGSPTIITAKKSWKFISISELNEFKDLFVLMVQRDVKVLYKQTALGFVWAILNPLLTMLLFWLVFGRFAGMQSDGMPYALWCLAGIVPWMYFSQALSVSANSLVAASSLLNQVFFPRLFMPLVPVYSKLPDLIIALVILLIAVPFFGISFSLNILFLPVILLLLITTVAAAGVWLSVLSLQFRDVKFAVGFLIQILLFLSPVIYPASIVPDNYQFMYGFHPLVGIIEGFRAAVFGHQPMPWFTMLQGAITSIIFLCTGLLYFRRIESKFADII